MRNLTLAAAALLAAETAAIACSCIATDDPAELRRFAADAAQDAIALVEAEALTSFEATQQGERMRVVRTIAGQVSAQFTIERGPMPSSASCDVLYEVGDRALVILYPTENAAGGVPVYRTSGLCTVHMLDKPVFRDELTRLMSARLPRPERG